MFETIATTEPIHVEIEDEAPTGLNVKLLSPIW
jgi:hypothetical protein